MVRLSRLRIQTGRKRTKFCWFYLSFFYELWIRERGKMKNELQTSLFFWESSCGYLFCFHSVGISLTQYSGARSVWLGTLDCWWRKRSGHNVYLRGLLWSVPVDKSLPWLHHCLQIVLAFELYSVLETGSLVLVRLKVVWDTRGWGQADVSLIDDWAEIDRRQW